MKNSAAIAVKVLAWLTLIGGLILWLMSVFVDFYESLPYLGVAIAGFILLRGFAEVIILLDKINENTQLATKKTDLIRVFAEIIGLLDKINKNTQPTTEDTEEEKS